MRDDDALDRPSNIGLCRELERIVSMLLHNNGDLIAIGSRRARLASGSKKRCRQPPARCGQGPVSCKVCRTCYFSIDRLNACLRKGGGFRPFRGDAHPEVTKVAEYVHRVHEAAYGAPFILPGREDRFVIRTINHQRLDTLHQRKLQVQRLVHDILRQTFDPISFRRQWTRHEYRERQGRITVADVEVPARGDEYMKRSTQPRNSSLERVVHPDEIQRAHQCLPEIHIAQVRFARELEPDISPSSGKHGWQPLDAHRGVDCMLGEFDRIQNVWIRTVEKPGSRVGPPRGSVTEYLFPEPCRCPPIPATWALDEFDHPYLGSG